MNQAHPDEHERDGEDEDFDYLSQSNAPLLNEGSAGSPRRHKSGGYALTPKGRLRAYWLGIVVCLGGFLCGVLTLSSFENDFRYARDEATYVSSLAVGLQQLGAFAACFAIWPITHKLGRRLAIVICSIMFIFGSLIQTVNTHSTSAFFFGRVVAGVGLGGSSVVVPMYSTEMTPKDIRGQIGSLYQLMFTFGIFTSYWIDYGMARSVSNTSSAQWQIPVGLQMLFAALLGIGTLTLKESVRWLTQNGRHKEAWESLKWIRASDGRDVQAEMDEIRSGVEREAHARQGFQLKEMLQRGNASRTVTGIAVFAAQQATGATAFAYFGPQYFKLLVGDKGNSDLLLTAIFGAVKVVACLAFVLFVADSVGRKAILTGGALFMAACQMTTAVVVKTYPADPEEDLTRSGVATVGLIYLFVIAYNFSWGPLVWPYVSEVMSLTTIFPARTREPGVALGVASQWAGNLIFSLTTPYMIKHLGWGTFLLWGLFDVVIAAYSWYGLLETQGKSLEEITQSHGDRGVDKNLED
ncbi:uncharacterized protein LTR77_007112 [Saxophila tyrrhenica]|uniref:Major facilitator superfamily (MFS) profile domain-containing protein n=1 Tax=Saxophila tyrrhenica TaxID=1690608 RepID=A0AAV9P476_9PEZI|nr:hypothetical protein LTR77_007112 [Saxophila tyrrhenica]